MVKLMVTAGCPYNIEVPVYYGIHKKRFDCSLQCDVFWTNLGKTIQLEWWSLKEANFKIFTGSADAEWSSGLVVHCIYWFSMAINITHWRSTIP